jgi:glycosyltransferase involved in cell wall biosynthesis
MSSPFVPGRVSVLTPAYNHEKYIIDNIRSVLSQDYQDVEHVIIDDGSSDSTFEVSRHCISEQTSPVKHLLTKQVNRGMNATLNELLRISTGEYVSVLASDDYLLPQSLSGRIRFLQENPNKLAVFGDFSCIDDAGETSTSKGLEERFGVNKADFSSDSRIRLGMLKNFSIAGPALLFHRSLIDQIGGFDEDLMIEDWDFYIRISARNLLGFLDQPVAAYRVHQTNTITNFGKSQRRCNYVRKVLEKNEQLYHGEEREFVHTWIRERKRKEISFMIESCLKRVFSALGLRKKKV